MTSKLFRNYDRRYLVTLLVLAVSACGGALKGGTISVGTPAVSSDPVYEFGIVACAMPAAPTDPCPRPIAGAKIEVQHLDGWVYSIANGDGFALMNASIPYSAVRLSANGFETVTASIEPPKINHTNVTYSLTPLHVDPSGIPLGQLAAIRGAMWPQGPLGSTPASATLKDGSACAPDDIPFGPRPGQRDNIIATDFIANYSDHQRLCIVAELKARGYTHVVMGPIVDSDGYHGQYAPHDWHWEDAAHVNGDNFDRFLDLVQFFYDHQLIPVVFLHPDGWSFEQTRDAFTPLLTTARAKRLLRIVVPTGWEPTRYDWSSCTWARFVRWTRDVFGPDALILIHTTADVDAPVGTDSLCDDNGKPNGEGWTRVLGATLDGWLIQNGAYSTAPAGSPDIARNFAAQFMADGDGAALHGARWHFAHGISSWPTTTWRGTPLLLYAAEHTSYTAYWQHMAEADRVLWGDLAIASGADGALDGVSVAVPVR
jgi:hypothetical protein